MIMSPAAPLGQSKYTTLMIYSGVAASSFVDSGIVEERAGRGVRTEGD
jgi:hypothetical protein